MKIEFDWEFIHGETGNFSERAKVFGGWIVRNIHYTEDCDIHYTSSMIFIPDMKHEWEIE